MTTDSTQNNIKDEFKPTKFTFAKFEANPIVTDKTKMLLSSSCGPIS